MAVALYTGSLSVIFGLTGTSSDPEHPYYHDAGFPQVISCNYDVSRKSWDGSASFAVGSLYFLLRYVMPGNAGYAGTETWRQKISEDEGAVTGDWVDYSPTFSAEGKPSGIGSIIFTCSHSGTTYTSLGTVAY